MITEAEWKGFQEKGYLYLGRLLEGPALRTLQARIDDIMLGKAELDYNRLVMQLDSPTGELSDAERPSPGHKGATLDYRKIENLEQDPLFATYYERPIFREVCAHECGDDAPIAYFRAIFMNKPSQRGTRLPWHQDAWMGLDDQPLLTIWTALDPMTRENGCVEVIPGSHLEGAVGVQQPSGFLGEAQVAERVRSDRIEFLELSPGEAVLMHKHLLHASDVNRSPVSRRTFSACYTDARTIPPGDTRFKRLLEKAAA